MHTSSIDPVKEVLLPNEMWQLDPSRVSNIYKRELEKLKREVTLLDWDGVTKDEYWRNAMSELKARITKWNPFLINQLVYDNIRYMDDPYVAFVDIREPENIISFGEYTENKVMGISVERVLVTSDESELFANYSDQSVNHIKYDIVVDNTRGLFVDSEISLLFLKRKAREFVELEVLEGRSKERFY